VVHAAGGGGGHDAAVVVGVEHYAHLPAVAGARLNSGDWFRYLTKVRDIPARRVVLLEDSDATPGKIKAALADAAANVGKEGTLWFVFVGHGAPTKDGKDGVLVGVDAHADPRDFYPYTVKRSEVLGLMQISRARSKVAVLDVCFAGLNADGGQVLSGAQFAVPGVFADVGDVVLLTAGRPRDIAGRLPGANRPAFSYLALGGLLGWADDDGNRRVTGREVVAYVRDVLRMLSPGSEQVPGMRLILVTCP